MAYQTGVSSTMSDLVTALVNFAVANGWTNAGTWTSSGDTIIALTRSGAEYVTLGHNTSALYLNTASAVAGSGATAAQTNAAPQNFVVRPIAPPHVGYHLFTDGLAVHCAVEVVAGVFTHINFGLMTKNGTWSGGTFVTGSCQTTNVGPPYTDVFSRYNTPPFGYAQNVGDSNGFQASPSHFRSSINGSGRTAGFGWAPVGMDYGVGSLWMPDIGLTLLTAPNAANGRAVIAPVTVLQASSGTSVPFYQLGHVPNCGGCNIANLDPKAVINTDWMVFPIGQKNGPGTSYINSGNRAMAYKK
jgi:hypothetical protein